MGKASFFVFFVFFVFHISLFIELLFAPQILLGGPVGPRLADLLDDRIHVPASVRQPEDQYHLILEYRDGDKWGDDVSKCSNRFILTRDSPNSRMTSMEPFFGRHASLVAN